MDYHNQRVYPMDSADEISISDGNPQPSKYVMLSENGGSIRPPPYRRNIPRYQGAQRKKSGSCVKCLLCCCCFLFILILILVTIVFLIYDLYKPKVPSYKVQGLDVSAFHVQPDFSLYTEFIVNIKAENPNEKIGITYGKDSMVLVTYAGSMLCTGKLPAFHQGYKNTTLMKVVLSGESDFGSGLQEAFMENKRSGRIPLEIRARVPVRILLGELPMRQIVVLVNCSLVVNNLDPKKKIEILSSTYNITASL